MTRPRKITLGEMRDMGVRGLLVCWFAAQIIIAAIGRRSAAIDGHHVRLSDLEPLFVCQACGIKGAELRPDFEGDKKQNNRQRHQKRAL
ncbi:MAG: hypothetical protein ACJ8EF_06015 [Bradyrhizobium sp.]|jgi:hypothetical protein